MRVCAWTPPCWPTVRARSPSQARSSPGSVAASATTPQWIPHHSACTPPSISASCWRRVRRGMARDRSSRAAAAVTAACGR
eukprot:359285-Chlamydomonas_euryale.AAC.1